MQPIIVIGTGLAGFNLIKELRKLDKTTPVIMLTSDDGRNYSKPMLSNGFAKQKDADALAMASAEQTSAQLDVTIRTGVSVTAIDTAAKQVEFGAEKIGYSKLVLALGADVFRPPMTGDALDQVYTVNDLMDYARFGKAVAGKKKVLIIGGGLIGCEFANDLLAGGFEVELIEPMGRCLPTLLPEPASRAVQQGLEAAGVKFHFGPFAQTCNHSGDGVLVGLSDGNEVQADIVLQAVGLRPRIALASTAGINVDRGIVVDRLLQTSAADVYALGDCAEVEGLVLPYILPLMSASRALAKTLAGEPTPVAYGVMPVSIKTPACPTVVCPPAPQAKGEWHCEGEGLNSKCLFRGDDGTLLGYALTGDACSEKQALNKQLPPLLS
ncbi:NAD(P)/FAD-dependent oxidoreductase [Alcanivorax sp. 1008]|uniref:NAD(P)/FAD-dependent oxidoreductase n=1 Tax=Alcanivorax sp. 1008 TaxID=2816853 RepID=UPI001DAD06DE|nr:FAD-dependent oxidoreductase [Alcanivorax sp. 1008]MCC1496066.1 FAD-dependent oxidoreductase [Alcanivorax sp. 1008]